MIVPGVTAVVAAYRVGDAFADNVDALLEQVERVVVVDDGSGTARGVLGERVDGVVELVELPWNRGIASALNAGVARALSVADARWVLTMDQDSRLGPRYVTRALEALEAARHRGVTAAGVSAASHNGVALRTGTPARGLATLFDAMQSGTLYPSSVLAGRDGFEEDLVIDAVDTEFHVRLRAEGLPVLAGEGLDLEHELGDRRPLRILGHQPRYRGRLLEIYYHAPFRTYYMTRNNLVVFRRWRSRFPRWCHQRVLLEAEGLAVALVFGPHRLRHLVAALAGWADAVRGRRGRIPDVLARLLRTS